MSDLIRFSPPRSFERSRGLIDRYWDEPPFSTRRPSPFETLDVFHPWRSGFFGEVFPGDNLEIDLYERGDHLVVKASLPGVPRENVEVLGQNGFLTIRAKHEASREREGAGWQVRQLRAGFWQRSIRLPEKVDLDRAEAELRDGVLTVTLPRLEPKVSPFRRIKVSLPKFRLPALNKKKREKSG